MTQLDTPIALPLIEEEDSYRIRADDLEHLVAAIFEKVSVPPTDAQIIAQALVEADLRGMNSHGILRLPIYIHRLQQGGFSPISNFDIVKETPSTSLIDGGNGLGAVLTTQAMDLAISKAQKSGIAAVGVRNSNHNGEGALYVSRAVQAGMIGIATTNASPIMPAWGGTTPITGPLPLAVGVPTDKADPIILDAALGMSSRGKILYYAEKGLELPQGWLVDADGNPTTDPNWINKGGWILPIGGHKGWGLILICEILSGLLTGGAFGRELTNLYDDAATPQRNGHFVIAINVESFISTDSFKQRIDKYICEMKSSDLAPGVDEILMPGELEARRRRQQLSKGISLNRKVVDNVISLGKELGIFISA